MQEVLVTSEICGFALSEMAALAFAEQLEGYDDQVLRGALRRCQRELKGRLTLVDVLSRLDDGRPGVDEAWAMLPWDEETTVVLTEEMLEAQGVVRHTYETDKIAARNAFKEVYLRLVAHAREEGRKPVWQVSMGWTPSGREAPIIEAAQKGRLTVEDVLYHLPQIEGTETHKQLVAAENRLRIGAGKEQLQIEGETSVPPSEQIATLKKAIAGIGTGGRK